MLSCSLSFPTLSMACVTFVACRFSINRVQPLSVLAASEILWQFLARPAGLPLTLPVLPVARANNFTGFLLSSLYFFGVLPSFSSLQLTPVYAHSQERVHVSIKSTLHCSLVQ